MRRAAAARVAFVLALAVVAGGLAATRPFTSGADLLTGAVLVAGAGWTVRTLALARRGGAPSAGAAGGAPVTWRSAAPWLAVLGAVVVVELCSFFGGARPSHPTLSSLYDTATRWEAAKALIALGWLGLGFALVRR